MDELYVARAMIEGEAIYHAVPRLTEQDFAALQQIIEQMVQATKAGDISSYIALNRDFHLHIYDALDNQYIVQVIHNLWKRSELYRYRYMYVAHDHERVHREHQNILDVCRTRDQAAAREAAVKHIQGTQYELHEQLQTAKTAPNGLGALADLTLPNGDD
jgi:DNA-binding GntR family transcriptional regulator